MKAELAAILAAEGTMPTAQHYPGLAEIAGIAGQPTEPETVAVPLAEVPPAPDAEPAPVAFPHGLTFSGSPKTWTGRIVALEDWRHLSAWERDGPGGRRWNGITRQWEEPG